MADTMSMIGNKARKLILHLDVNNTIFVGDSKTKLTALEGVLNEYMTEIVWGNVFGNVWRPLEKPISNYPPTNSAISYYEYAEKKFEEEGKTRPEFKEHTKRFTFEGIGQQFRSYVDKVKEKLKAPEIQSHCAELDAFLLKEPNALYYRILPSYFKLLEYLLRDGREFSILLRTFGGDGDMVLKATQLYVQNKHPEWKFPQGKTLNVNCTPSRIVPSRDGLSVITSNGSRLDNWHDIYDTFSHSSGVQLFLDSYDWWKQNGFTSKAGKPLLIDPMDKSVYHIFLDDNIRSYDPSNNIVSLLVKEQGQFVHKDSKEFDGTCLLRTDLFESILNDNYFINILKQCEDNYVKYQEK